MQSIFKTASLSFRDLGITTLAGFLIFPLIGFEKWLSNKLNK